MKVKIIVSNSQSQVEGLTPELEKSLKAELRYLNQNVAYTYHGNLRAIERIKKQLNSKVTLDDRARQDLSEKLK